MTVLTALALSTLDDPATHAPAAPIATGPTPQMEPSRLEPDRPVAREIAAGETHSYRVALKANEVLHLRVTQLGADIVVTVAGADGTPIVEMDTPTGTAGVEQVWFVAPASGEFRVGIKTFEGYAGRYELRADAVRGATPEDVKRVQLQSVFLEANRLSLQQTPEAHRTAIEKFKEATALARSVGERDMAALSLSVLRGLDIGAALESMALPSLPGKISVAYSPGYEQRAAMLRDKLERGIGFFERTLGVTPKIHLVVLTKEDWSTLSFAGVPYGIPNSSWSRTQSGLVCMPATHEAFDELGRTLKARLPDTAVKAIESSGVSFEQAMRAFADNIMYHELGHLYAFAYGIVPPNRWVNELVANFMSVAYESEQGIDPQLQKLQPILRAGMEKGPRPAHTTLEDFERLYTGVGNENYGWYQMQITARAAEVYKAKKLDFLKELKAAFPPNERRPLPVDVSLDRLEKITPGFIEWARRLESGGNSQLR